MLLEVCVDSISSMLTAKKAGADRIELCSALNIGGLTPSKGLMDKASEIDGMEIYIMIRPRSGDFLYDDHEFETMKNNIKIAKKMGFGGIVTGVLLSDGRIDTKRMRELVSAAKPLKTVLHRAFDDAKHPEENINELIEMGVCRILTSGQRSNALEGAKYIGMLQTEFGDAITIMPGCGINAENMEKIYEITKCTNYHMSGKANTASAMVYRACVERMGTSENEFIVESADYTLIAKARDVLDKIKTDLT